MTDDHASVTHLRKGMAAMPPTYPTTGHNHDPETCDACDHLVVMGIVGRALIHGVARMEIDELINAAWDTVYEAVQERTIRPAFGDRVLEEIAAIKSAFAATLASSQDGEAHQANEARWAFLNPETGDWIEVAPGTVFTKRQAVKAAEMGS